MSTSPSGTQGPPVPRACLARGPGEDGPAWWAQSPTGRPSPEPQPSTRPIPSAGLAPLTHTRRHRRGDQRGCATCLAVRPIPVGIADHPSSSARGPTAEEGEFGNRWVRDLTEPGNGAWAELEAGASQPPPRPPPPTPALPNRQGPLSRGAGTVQRQGAAVAMTNVNIHPRPPNAPFPPVESRTPAAEKARVEAQPDCLSAAKAGYSTPRRGKPGDTARPPRGYPARL